MQLFPVSIAIYVGASALGVVVSCALIFVIGIIGAPIGLLAAALALALGHLAYLARLGITVTFRWRWALQWRQLELFGYIVAGVALGLAQQLGVVFALSAVTLAHGSATLYSYAFFITAVMLNLSSVPLSVTIMPRVIADVDRLGSEAIVNNLVLATPYVLVVLLPMLSAFAAFGKPILEAVFGAALSASNITELYRLTVCLSLVAISTSIFGVAGSMLLATRQWRLVATVALAAIVVEAAVIYPSWPAGVYAVALAHGVGASLGTVIMLVALFRRRVFAVVGKLAKVSAPAPALCIVFVIAPLVITGSPSLPVDLLLLTLSLTAYCLMAVAFWPEVSQRFVNLFARRSLFRLRSSA
jgi:peptidoglycan biosynthesis protein MviN/MurJ (putative lipid II flippase)